MAYWKARTFDVEYEAVEWFEANGFYQLSTNRWEDGNGRWAVVKFEDGFTGLIGSENNDLEDIEEPAR